MENKTTSYLYNIVCNPHWPPKQIELADKNIGQSIVIDIVTQSIKESLNLLR